MILELLAAMNLSITALSVQTPSQISNNLFMDFDQTITSENINDILLNHNKKIDLRNSISHNSFFGNGELNYLNDNYSGYNWVIIDENNISNVSGHEIVCIQKSSLFPYSDINSALEQSSSQSSYGGCGPIALIGVFDYFARYLGYNEIMNNPNNSVDRIELATAVFNRTPTFELPDGSTFTFATDFVSAFANILALDLNYNLYENVLRAYHTGTYFGGMHDYFWSIITTSVDNGLPVTLSYLGDDYGDFHNHYTNIFAYSTWFGTNSDLETKTVHFIKAKHNWNISGSDYICCESSILNEPLVNLIYYDIEQENTHIFDASSFQYDFINDNGCGQYFFYPKSVMIATENVGSIDDSIYTTRLRTSFIENQYLVMSPYRQNAGTAYLDFLFYHPIEKLEIDMGLWSTNENINGQTFYIQRYDSSNNIINHIQYNLSNFSNNKDNLKSYNILFPKGTNHIRFYTFNPNATGNRNKGRIVLDNFKFYYNY